MFYLYGPYANPNEETHPLSLSSHKESTYHLVLRCHIPYKYNQVAPKSLLGAASNVTCYWETYIYSIFLDKYTYKYDTCRNTECLMEVRAREVKEATEGKSNI